MRRHGFGLLLATLLAVVSGVGALAILPDLGGISQVNGGTIGVGLNPALGAWAGSSAGGLQVAVAVDHTIAVPGDTLTYAIRVTNAGRTVTSADVTDNISALLARAVFVEASPGGALGGSSVTWAGVEVAPETTVELHLSVRLDSSGWNAGTTTLANVVVAPGTNCAARSIAPECGAVTIVSAKPSLTVSQVVSQETAAPGDTLAYTITVRNTGTGDAAGVEVGHDISDVLAHGALVSASGGGALRNSTVGWTNLFVEAGSSRTLRVVVRLGTDGWSSGTTTLATAVLVPDSDCAAGSARPACRTSTAVSAQSRLVVTSDVSAADARPGEDLTWTVAVENTGDGDATGVTITIDASAVLVHGTWLGASAGGSLGGHTVRWDDQSIPTGAARTYSFGTHLATDGWTAGKAVLTNVVTVTGSNCADGIASGSCAATTTVDAQFGLALTHRVSGSSSGPWRSTYRAAVGDPVWYRIEITNTGNASLTGVTVIDATDSSAGPCPAVPPILEPGAGWSCVRSQAAAEGTIMTVVSALSDQTEPLSDAVTVEAGESPQPAIDVVASDEPPVQPTGGGVAVLSFRVTNPGNVVLSDPGLSVDTCGTLMPVGGDDNADGRLDVDETWLYRCTATIRATARVTATASGSYGSTRVTASTRIAAVVRTDGAAVHLDVHASPASLPAGGGTTEYTYVLRNSGDVALTGAGVTDDTCQRVDFVDGDDNADGRLDPDEAWRFRCGARLTSTTTSTATAVARAGDVLVSDTDRITVVVADAPTQPAARIGLALTADPAVLPAGGGSVTYEYALANLGDVALTEPAVRADACPPDAGRAGDLDADGVLDVGETWTYRCTTSLRATATITIAATARWGSDVLEAAATTTVTVASPAPSETAPTASEGPGATPVTGSPAASGPSATPGGSVAGVTSPPRPSATAGGILPTPPGSGTTPSGLLLVLIVALAVTAAALITTVGRRPSRE